MSPGASGTSIRKLGYQPALDGLRAISVLAVIGYHADLKWLRGGFLGVEVFFVISGFLITSLLLEERVGTGRIRLRHFWIRRARRLLPALYLLLLVVCVFALLGYRDAAGRLGGDVIAALAYVSNWWNIFLNESYFLEAGRPPLLRHLWSLAVEEQFYVIFPPLFVLALGRFRFRRIQIGLVVIACMSTLAMALMFEPYSDPSRVYYGTDTRLAGMLIGALLAMVWSPWRSQVRAHPRAAEVLDGVGVLAFAGLVVFLVKVNEFDPFIYRGGFLLLDIVCIILIGAMVHPSSRISRLFEWKVLVWIGLRSYAIYLWHWPIFQVTRPELDVPISGAPLFVMRMALTIGAAELSFRFVEQPFRKGLLGDWWRRFKGATGLEHELLRRQGVLVSTGSIIVVLLVGAGLAQASTDSHRAELEAAALTAPPAKSLNTGAGKLAPKDEAHDSKNTPSTTEANAVPGTAPGTTAAPTSSTTETPPIDGSQVVAVGDSVMLGAATAISSELPGVRIDAKVGRQFKEILGIVRWYVDQGLVPGPLVVHIGTNGAFSDGDIDRLFEAAGDRKVLLINAKVARPWEELVNQRIASAVDRHPNGVLLDWHGLSSQHPEWFANDGAHLRPAGTAAFAELIRSNL